ncbi:MAG: BglII/BstYI family type II restriction endonuclease [Candidatus Bathyarchaeia archaeon]
MEIIAEYSFNGGKEFIEEYHKAELLELKDIISSVDALRFKTKESKEKTMPGRLLYNPKELNKEFKRLLAQRGWETIRINVKTYVPEIGEEHIGFREMDAVKNKLGVEVQFGKYAFMVYNVAAKMTIFNKQGIIDSGVEIVPMLSLANEMSSGVSYFEQIKTDLEYRGVSNIDIPVLVIGVDAIKRSRQPKLI